MSEEKHELETFDESDPFEVALERQLKDLEMCNESWGCDKKFPPNVVRAAILCNQAEMEGIGFALLKYRAAKINGFALRPSAQALALESASVAIKNERARWEREISKTTSNFQCKVNGYKQRIGELLQIVSRRKQQAVVNHYLHDLDRSEIGRDKFMRLLDEAIALAEFEKENYQE